MPHVIITSSKVEEPVDAKHCFITIGPNCWGKGRTASEALANAKANGPHDRKRHNYYTRVAPADCTVHDIDGSVMWNNHDATTCPFCTVGKGLYVRME